LVPDGPDGAFAVEGDTFPHRELIKSRGGRWSGSRRRWLFTFDAAGAPSGFPEPAGTASGLAEDVGANFQGWGSKYYHGHRERLRKRFLEGGPAAVADYLFFDRKNILIRDEVQSKGTVDQTPLYPREVVKRALGLGASAIVMVHNHPSGDPTRPRRTSSSLGKSPRH
jgi:hypothetical protein